MAEEGLCRRHGSFPARSQSEYRRDTARGDSPIQERTFEGSAEAAYAEGNDYHFKGHVSTPLGDDAGLRVAGGYRHRDGQIDNITLGRKVDFDETWNLRASLALRPVDRLRIST